MHDLGAFVWSIADQLRGVYKPHQYGDVILPMTLLRRLDGIRASAPDRACVFRNATPWTFALLLEDPGRLETNLLDFIGGFSEDLDVFDRFHLEDEVRRLAEKDRLLVVVQRFAAVDLHPDAVSNAEMGDLFEELIRRFAESSAQGAGEHFTPRDAIRLMVDLLLAGDRKRSPTPGFALYDPAAGTGGMLSVAGERLRELVPGARVRLYGQEINDQSYAICKSDMIARGQDPASIRLGDTLAEDLFAGQTFDYCLSNPPYGVDWKAARARIVREAQDAGGRFPGGLPPTSDGQMLFLQHVVAKLRPAHEGGGRAGIVLSGSPLFAGGAGSGPSGIRRWLLENDLVDAIVALPTRLFHNTGIATYVWILDNAKRPERAGTVQLIDGTAFASRMRKSLGRKSREISDEDRAQILGLYDEHAEGERSRILPTHAFGYWSVTVERPQRDEAGEALCDRRGRPKADAALRSTERVPFADGDGGAGSRDAVVQAYVDAEIAPHAPDAWVDAAKTRIGYEIPFARHFHVAPAHRALAEIEREVSELVSEILALLREAER